MKTVCLIFLLFFVFDQVYSRDLPEEYFYVGTFTSEGAEGIYLCSFNPENGTVKMEEVFRGIDNPSFLRISPDRKFLYVVTRPPVAVEREGGYVAAYRIGQGGRIHFLNKQLSHGLDPCHVDVSPDGRYVAAANYGSGTVSLFPVNNDGSLLPASSVYKNEGSGTDPQRQSSPHAHSVKFSLLDEKMYSADLGTDELIIFTRNKNVLNDTLKSSVRLSPGAGPRHFVIHRDGQVIYVINELNSTISVLKKQVDNWRVFQEISTLPKDFTGKSFCADIHFSADQRFIYGSNRGDNSLFVAAVESNSKRLVSMGTVETHGDWPRNFVVTRDGRFLLVANQRSGNITVFRIDKETGIPVFTGNQLNLPSPVCLEFL